jgi:uncharacterized protein involved in outer membrane biogenesis
MKRLLAILGGLLALVLVLLLVLPILFRDKIAARVKAAVNQNVAAKVDWSNVGVSFFRHFPNLTLRLDDLTVATQGRFAGDTLAAIRHFDVAVSLPSVLSSVLGSGGGPIVIRALTLNQPRLSLVALEDGTVNWDISRQSPEPGPHGPGSSQSKAMDVSLRQFEIKDGAISFDNRKAKLKATFKGYNQSLSGDFSQKQVAVQTRANVDTASVTFAGIPYLNRVKLGLVTDAQADMVNKSYVLKQTELSLNDLKLGVSGSAKSIGKLLGLDLTFNAPSTNFRSILSLVPAVYAHDFDKLKTSGSFTVSGRVKGEYGDSAFPAFQLVAKVNNAAFQYPDLPLPVRDVVMDLAVSNPGGSADSTVVKLDRFHLLLGKNPVDAGLVLKTPISDPDVDLKMKGKVDLADVRRAVKLQSIDQLTGTIAADAAVHTRMSYVDKKQYDKVAASGSVDVSSLTVSGKTLPHPVAIQQASLQLKPARAELTTFRGSVGSSDLQATGSLDNLISYVFRDDTLRGTATVHSNRLNLDDWKSGKANAQIIPVPAKVDFTVDATIAQLIYGKLKATNAQGRLRIKDRRATLENFRMNAVGGQIGITGSYATVDTTKPTFDVGFKMIKANIPAAFETFLTVQKLAPVAKYASGTVNTDVHVSGALGQNMLPLFSALTGKGTLQTQNVSLHDFPAMNKIVEVTKLSILKNPTMEAIRTAFQIQQGKLAVAPFTVRLGPVSALVSGWNSIDETMDYKLELKVPRSLLGGANQALTGLVSKAGINLASAPEIPLAIQLTGPVTNPSVKVDVGSLASSVTQGATGAVKQAVTQKVDSAAMRLVQEAQNQAAGIKQQAESLAANVKRLGYQQADSLVGKGGSNPLVQAGAQVAADRLRQESDNKAKGIVDEASRRADSLVAQAKRQAGVK